MPAYMHTYTPYIFAVLLSLNEHDHNLNKTTAVWEFDMIRKSIAHVGLRECWFVSQPWFSIAYRPPVLPADNRK